jgi:hypothetical protein
MVPSPYGIRFREKTTYTGVLEKYHTLVFLKSIHDEQVEGQVLFVPVPERYSVLQACYRDFKTLEPGPPWFVYSFGEHPGYSVTRCVNREEEIKVRLNSPLDTSVPS